MRFADAFRLLLEGGWSCAVLLHAWLGAHGAHISILGWFGKALAACDAMCAHMARSHSAHCRRRDCSALSMTHIRPGSLVRGHPACWVVDGLIPPQATQVVRLNGIKRCAAGFQASNQVPLPRACPCSERACLKPLHLDCMRTTILSISLGSRMM